jgi:hypothetical protein
MDFRMAVMLNSVLKQEGFDPSKVRLMRHQDVRRETLHSPYELWRDNRPNFELYQSVQGIKNRPKFSYPIWASFVADPAGATLFVGIYTAEYIGVGNVDLQRPHSASVDKAGMYDRYSLKLDNAMVDLAGRLYVDWGLGTRAWVQRAKDQNKPIIEIRPSFKEEKFPGFGRFIKSLSEINALPLSWIAILRETRGVYLLTCPKTKEQYVGSATGADGLWGRWQTYIANGHGGNIGLKSKDPSDYRVSILETAGSLATVQEIIGLEQLWKTKLQSQEMGLNKN